MKKVTLVTACLLVMTFATSCNQSGGSGSDNSSYSGKAAKYVFFFIGDGMAQPQIAAAEAYLAQANNSSAVNSDQLTFTKFPAQGMSTTYAADRYITDSAAAGTALATGKKTNCGVVGMDPAKAENYTSLSEIAHKAGMKVGIISSVCIDHATPASFYAHQPTRNDYYEIDLQMIDSGFEYFAGGNPRLGKTPKDKKNILEIMKEKGWTIADDRSKLEGLTSKDFPILAYGTCFKGDTLKYDLDREKEDVSLAEFTKKGIEVLDNDKGFFIMVESGKIDWAGHANDAASNIHDTIAFSESIQVALDFYKKHPKETLIVVTGDHETGGMTLGFSGTKYESAFTEVAKQKKSYEWFDKYVVKPYKKDHKNGGSFSDLEGKIAENFGLTDLSDYERSRLKEAFARSMKGDVEKSKAKEDYLLYGGYEPLTMTITHLANQRAGLGWTTYSHTAVPVPVFAVGAGQGLFNGYYDNTDVQKKILLAMKK